MKSSDMLYMKKEPLSSGEAKGVADWSPDLFYATGHVGATAAVALSSPGAEKQWERRVGDSRRPPAVIITQPHG